MTPFGIFWLAQAVSRFGDPITLIALATLTYRATSSALLTALAVVVGTLPGAVFGLIGGSFADALTFVVSAVLLLRVKTPEPAGSSYPSVQRLFKDASVGMRYLFSSSVLRANTTFSLVAQLASPVANGLSPVLVIRHFARGD